MSNIQNTMDLLFPGQRQQVLAALLLQSGTSLHLREWHGGPAAIPARWPANSPS